MLVLRQALWGRYAAPHAAPAAQPLELELRADRAGRLLYRGRLELGGRLSARGLAADAPISGSVALGPRREPLRYDLVFEAGGGAFRLVLCVRFDWRRALLSSSTLLGALHGPGDVRYDVVLRYDYRRDLRGLLHWE